MLKKTHSRRGAERGSTLLVATGLVTLVTLGALASLQVIRSDSEVQGYSRREREAFFAAQAGLAEAKEKIAQLLPGDQTDYTSVIRTLKTEFGGIAAPDLGNVDDPWFDVLCRPGGNCAGTPGDRWTPYGLITTSAAGGAPSGAAIDDGVETADAELRDPSGKAYRGFPTQSEVFYRVFLRDDRDDVDPANGALTRPEVDSNRKVWLVSVGEVRVGGGRSVRSVVQALVTAGTGGMLLSGDGSQAHNGPTQTSANRTDTRLPDVTISRDL
ncbi:MAG: pilus assembly PilX N-terminal domain-containing protein [Myxococcaceae bacterium]